MGSVTALASALPNTPTASPVPIPDSVKNLDDLYDYLKSKGAIKTADDFMVYMKNNKQVILKLSPGLIDYGFTYRQYAETFKPVQNDGIIKVTNNHGFKEVQLWSVTLFINNTSKETLEISKDNFALVPKIIPEGQALNVLAIGPESIMDVSNNGVLGVVKIPAEKEIKLNVIFTVFPLTSENAVKLRIYDGKDHMDINIAK